MAFRVDISQKAKRDPGRRTVGCSVSQSASYSGSYSGLHLTLSMTSTDPPLKPSLTNWMRQPIKIDLLSKKKGGNVSLQGRPTVIEKCRAEPSKLESQEVAAMGKTTRSLSVAACFFVSHWGLAQCTQSFQVNSISCKTHTVAAR